MLRRIRGEDRIEEDGGGVLRASEEEAKKQKREEENKQPEEDHERGLEEFRDEINLTSQRKEKVIVKIHETKGIHQKTQRDGSETLPDDIVVDGTRRDKDKPGLVAGKAKNKNKVSFDESLNKGHHVPHPEDATEDDDVNYEERTSASKNTQNTNNNGFQASGKGKTPDDKLKLSVREESTGVNGKELSLRTVPENEGKPEHKDGFATPAQNKLLDNVAEYARKTKRFMGQTLEKIKW